MTANAFTSKTNVLDPVIFRIYSSYKSLPLKRNIFKHLWIKMYSIHLQYKRHIHFSNESEVVPLNINKNITVITRGWTSYYSYMHENSVRNKSQIVVTGSENRETSMRMWIQYVTFFTQPNICRFVFHFATYVHKVSPRSHISPHT